MAKNIPVRLAENFINELTSEETKHAFEQLDSLREELESKVDPEPTEIYLIENIYHFIEKFKILENNIRSYVRNNNENLRGNVLSKLYERSEDDLFRTVSR